MSAATAKCWTYAEYAQTPEDNRHWEVIDGRLLGPVSQTPKHQEALGRLASAMWQYANERKLGRVYPAPLDGVLDDTNIVQPDIDRDAEGVDVFVLDNGQYSEVESEAGEARSEILLGFTIKLRELFA